MSKTQNTNAGKTETTESTGSTAPKNFRNHPDIENFFRFIYENDLREEGLEILNEVLKAKAEKRLQKKPLEL